MEKKKINQNESPILVDINNIISSIEYKYPDEHIFFKELSDYEKIRSYVQENIWKGFKLRLLKKNISYYLTIVDKKQPKAIDKFNIFEKNKKQYSKVNSLSVKIDEIKDEVRQKVEGIMNNIVLENNKHKIHRIFYDYKSALKEFEFYSKNKNYCVINFVQKEVYRILFGCQRKKKHNVMK